MGGVRCGSQNGGGGGTCSCWHEPRPRSNFVIWLLGAAYVMRCSRDSNASGSAVSLFSPAHTNAAEAGTEGMGWQKHFSRTRLDGDQRLECADRVKGADLVASHIDDLRSIATTSSLTLLASCSNGLHSHILIFSLTPPPTKWRHLPLPSDPFNASPSTSHPFSPPSSRFPLRPWLSPGVA